MTQAEDRSGTDVYYPFPYDPSVEETLTPLWREAAWGLEWLQLRCSPVFFGRGVPRGNAEPVLLVPGFLTGDLMLLEMHRWLRRIGYRSYLSHITWNTDCPDKTARALGQRARALFDHTGQTLRLVGHSLGGMLAKAVVQEEPDIIDRVITMGSPFRNLVKAHPAVVGIWDILKIKQSGLVGRNLKTSCGTGHCTCSFVHSMIKPKTCRRPQFAIYSKRDGVVHWTSCIEEDPAHNVEVNGTHTGMVFQPAAYRALAKLLAQPV